jgi:hypothetical protein
MSSVSAIQSKTVRFTSAKLIHEREVHTTSMPPPGDIFLFILVNIDLIKILDQHSQFGAKEVLIRRLIQDKQIYTNETATIYASTTETTII